jgi:hypothetical protein
MHNACICAFLSHKDNSLANHVKFFKIFNHLLFPRKLYHSRKIHKFLLYQTVQ